MKLTTEQLKRLLQEQAALEQKPWTEADAEGYTKLFKILADEKGQASNQEPFHIADEVMNSIVRLQEQRDGRIDTVNLTVGIGIGIIALAAIFYFIDFSLLQSGLSWITNHLDTIVFSLVAIVLVQLADRRLVRR